MNASSTVAATMTVVTVLCCSGVTQADLIRLSNGGELRGELQESPARDASQLVIRTLTGAVVSVSRDQVEFTARRPSRVEDYETRARNAPDTVDGQWELAEWCRLNRLGRERAVHLERIIQLDPEHRAAHRGLDHVFEDGAWLPREELMQRKGYVRYKGRYISREERDLHAKSDAQRQREREWYRRIRLWHKRLTGRDAGRRSEALAEFRQIRDPAAIDGLTRIMSGDSSDEVRRLMIDVLDRIPGNEPVAALVRQSIYDSSRELRSDALHAIDEQQFSPAVDLYVRELGHSLNPVVRRAAKSLATVGDRRVVPQLIEALVTRHRYRVRVADTASIGFGTDGSFRFGPQPVRIPAEIDLMLRTGQLPDGVIVLTPPGTTRTKLVTVSYDHRNKEVLSLLRALTEEDFGYDERTWRMWYRAEKHGA